MKFLISFILFLCVFHFEAKASNNLKKISLPNDRTITITGHPDYAPIIWFNKSTNQFQGIAVDLIEKILKEADITPKFVNVETWARAQEEVKNGRIDMLLPPYKTPDRLAFYNYSANAFLMDSTVVFVKKGNEFKFDKITDLFKHSGVAIVNDSFGTEFDNLDKKTKHLIRLTSTEQCFRFVDKGRASYVVAGFHSGLMAMAQLNLTDSFTYLPNRIIVTGLYAPVSLKSPWNTPDFNNYLKTKFDEYNEKGTIKELEKKYLQLLKKEFKQSI